SRGRESRKNLARVHRELETSYFRPQVEGVSPSEHDLASPLPHLLITRHGRLDLLGTAHAGLDYDDLLPRTTMVPLDTGVEVRVLDLQGLIEMKERVGRDKDKLHVLHLKRVLEERKKQGKEEA